MRLVDRDYRIMREIDRWSFCLGRHIKELVEFSGQGACDRRLKLLAEAEYIQRKRVLYGVAGLYTLTYKGKQLLNLPIRAEKIRVEQVVHDIAVLDTAIYFVKKDIVSFDRIITEKELHRQDGFGRRKHRPDFVFAYKDNKTVCAEVELTLKAKDRLIKNIRENFMAYDVQIWVVSDMRNKITSILNQNEKTYPNIKILTMDEVNKWKN